MNSHHLHYVITTHEQQQMLALLGLWNWHGIKCPAKDCTKWLILHVQKTYMSSEISTVVDYWHQRLTVWWEKLAACRCIFITFIRCMAFPLLRFALNRIHQNMWISSELLLSFWSVAHSFKWGWSSQSFLMAGIHNSVFALTQKSCVYTQNLLRGRDFYLAHASKMQHISHQVDKLINSYCQKHTTDDTLVVVVVVVLVVLVV